MNERFILGSKVNNVSFEQAVKMTAIFLVTDKTNYIVTPNAEICLKGYRDPDLRHIIKKADLAIPDGFGLKIGGAIMGQQIDHQVPGVDLSMEIFRLANEKGYTILLIGGKGKSGTRALRNLKTQFPNLRVEYLNGGEFSQHGVSEYPDFIDQINRINPHVVLVNLGAPKQEYFIWNNKDRLNARLLIGVGGTIDFLAGKVKRAPAWVNKIGMEWLFRVFHEPWRWKRILNAVIFFPLVCIWWKLRNMTIYRRNVVGFIINNNKDILLAKRAPRPGDRSLHEHWQLPQGGVDPHESLEKAALREMMEETGLNKLDIVEYHKNVYKYAWPRQARLYAPYKGQKQSLFLFVHTGEPNEVNLDQKEFVEYKWVNKHHILQLAHEYRRPLIKLALKKFSNYL